MKHIFSSTKISFFVVCSFFVLCVILASYLIPHTSVVSAQTIQCDTPQQKIQCQALYDQTVAEQKQAENDLAAAKAKSSSLTNDIAVLTARIKAAELDIKAKNLLIQTLGNDITAKQSHINELEDSINRGRQSLAVILRKMNEVDSYSLPEMILSQDTVVDFFYDLDTFGSVQQGLKTTFEQLRADQQSTSAEKDALTARQNAEQDARYAIQQRQKSIQADQKSKQQLLAISKGDEKTYTSIAAQKASAAAQILAALFPLAGSKSIPFGDALKYANLVYQKTGVPPAFLLAMLKQETNIGANVGTCYMTNPSDGSGINTRTGNSVLGVMKLSRDVKPFLDITSALGYDYKTTPVSCPQSVGYGGGMGPAQFIASTWVLFTDRLKSALGISSEPNPWKPLDSFMAAGIYMADLGANSTSYSAQKTAACRYYGGGTRCTSVTSPYGNSVIALAYTASGNMQSLIDQVQ